MEVSGSFILSLIVSVVLIQGICLSLLVLNNKVFRNKSNTYFAYFLFIMMIIGSDSLLSPFYSQLNDFWFAFFDVVGDDIPWIMLVYLPLFTFFLRSTNLIIRFPILYLYLPFFTFLILNLLIDLDFDFDLISVPFLTDNRIIIYSMEDFISITLFSVLHLYIYIAAIRTSSDKWLKKLWWYCIVLIVFWLILSVEQLVLLANSSDFLPLILWACISIFIYWLMYTGLFQFNMASNRKMIREKLMKLNAHSSEIKSKSKSKKNSYFEKLLDLMERQKCFRDPNLSRETVAQQLGISSSYLTQLIKEQTGNSFTRFINAYRVRDVEQMLNDSSFKDFDLLSIGLEAGFNSKSAFYATFKSINGSTPKQYRLSLN